MEKDPTVIDFFEQNYSPPVDNSLEKVPPRITQGSNKKYRNLFLGILAVLLVIWGAYNIFQIYLANKSSLDNPPQALEQNQLADESNITDQNDNKPLEPIKPQELELTLEIVDKTREKDACWIQAYVDGTLTYEGILYEGEQKQFKGKENINLTLGNAGVVNLKLGERGLGTPGEVNQVVRKTFTLQDLE